MNDPSLATLLREAIERWALKLRDTSQLSQLVQAQQLTPRALAFYLESLRHLFQNSQQNLALAAQRCRDLNELELAEYFARKAEEEVGHDAWAKSDLAKLPRELSSTQRPASAVLELIDLQRDLIAQHPLCFAAYALWAEYFTVLLGDQWLDALAGCGYPRTQVTAIAKHIEADREHARRGFDEIDALWHGQPPPEALLRSVQRAGGVFETFCDEICAESRRAA
jgi:hypothetical protein